MRIAHLSSTLASPLGGAEQYCMRLAGWQHARGADVSIIASEFSTDVEDWAADAGVRLELAPVTRPYSARARGRNLATKILFHGQEVAESVASRQMRVRASAGAADVLHVHRLAGYGTQVIALAGIPTVHTVHDYYLVDSRNTSARAGALPDSLSAVQKLRRAAMARPYRRSHAQFVFPSERTLQRHLKLGFDVSPERLHVVPHGWDLGTPEVGSTHSPDPTGVTFCFLGKFSVDKGVRDILDAWGAGLPGARLIFAGAGELEEEVRTAAIQIPGIEFWGWVGSRERAELLRVSDALILASQWPENSPLVAAEAHLSGTAIVTSALATPPLFLEGSNGLTYGQDGPSLRARLEQLVDSRELRETLKAGAHTTAKALDPARHLDALEAVYDAARSGASS